VHVVSNTLQLTGENAMHKARSQQVWRGDSVSCICSSKQRSSGDDGKRRRTMANDGERRQTVANDGKQPQTKNPKQPQQKKQEATINRWLLRF